MFGLRLLVQVAAATVGCMAVGAFWYSSRLFGRIWWHYQFPGKKFGECTTPCVLPLSLTAAVLVVQNTVLGILINSLLWSLGPCVLPYLELCHLPIACAAVITMVTACASLPHYLFAQQPLALYLIASGHDTAQITTAIFIIYTLA